MTAPGGGSDTLEAVLLRLLEGRAEGGTISPTDVAREVAGNDPEQWSRLMGPVRRVAVKLMREGRIAIVRKGRPVDPDDFRGVYRIRLPVGD